MKNLTFNYTTNFKYYRLSKDNIEKEQEKFLTTFKHILGERIPKDLNVEIQTIKYTNDDKIFIQLKGNNKDDLVFVSNILKEITGETFDSRNVPKNKPLHGIFKSIGKIGFGIFVDIGIQNPDKEVLIPLFRLREQLTGGKKVSNHEILTKYGFLDFLPTEIEVVKMEHEKGGKSQFEGKFSEKFLEKLREWIEIDLDIIFTTGVSRQKIKRTVAKRGHTMDIVRFQRLGPLETAVICKEDTNAPGIISHIGPYLPDCRFSTLRPKHVKKFWNQK